MGRLSPWPPLFCHTGDNFQNIWETPNKEQKFRPLNSERRAVGAELVNQSSAQTVEVSESE